MAVLSYDEVLIIHQTVLQTSGGDPGILNEGALRSSVDQPRMTFGGVDLYPTVVEKSAALCYSIVNNHAFVDGNKRTGHAAMENFLQQEGYRIDASVDEQEAVILAISSHTMSRDAFIDWLWSHIVPTE